MFTNLTVGIIAGLGIGGWVYGKLSRSTGGNTQNALTGAVITGLITLLVIVTVLGLIF